MKFENVNQLSEKLLLQVKMQEPTDALVEVMQALTLNQLMQELRNDTLKKAFWINVYNAYYQILRKVNKAEKPGIYKDKLIHIANETWSLDDIEHGILRRYRHKLSRGYLPQFFVSKIIKKMAVDKVDWRIHFALNCGAKSCPPIAFYTADRLEQQLEMATLSFLESETDVLEDNKEIHITALFSWFRADFGGTAGIRKILDEKLKIDTKGYKLVYQPYSWEEELDNFNDKV